MPALLVTLMSLGAVFGAFHSEQAPVETVRFAFSSLNERVATTGSFKGIVIIGPDSVSVVFEEVRLSIHPMTRARAQYHLDSMKVSLIHETPRGWANYSDSRTLVIPDSLAERPRMSPGRITLTIARNPGIDLRKSWIGVTFYQIVSPSIVPRHMQAAGMTFAHSARDIFAGTKR